MISPETTTNPVFTSVSHATRPERIVAQHRVQHAVGDLVGDLVRMTLGHGLRGEQELVVGVSHAVLPSLRVISSK